jgi:hypothetical protein
MVWISRLGLEVPYDEWLRAYTEYQACERACADESSQCLHACMAKFPVPPNSNIEAAVSCMNECSQAHQSCLSNCSLMYFIALGFSGSPDDLKDPMPAINEHKDVFKETRKGFEKIGNILQFGGGILRRRAPGRPLKRVAAAADTFGSGLSLIAHFLEQAEKDPPDDDFQHIWSPRRYEIPLITSDELSGTAFAPLFLPFLSQVMLTISYLEGMAISLDRASAALRAGVQEKHLAQLRVSQRYAAACADTCRRMQEARIMVAEKLIELGMERSAGEDERRIVIDGETPDFRLGIARRPGGQEIISFDDIVSLHDEWSTNGIDEEALRIIDELSPDQSIADAIKASILAQTFARSDFDKFFGEILRTPEVIQAEDLLIDALRKWDRFYLDT